MHSDIDSLMESRNLDGLIIVGSPGASSDFLYMAGPVKVTSGYLVKKRDSNPLLICGLMERDEAAKSGLTVKLFSDFGYEKIFKETKNSFEASANFIVRILRSLECGRRIAIYGSSSIPYAVNLVDQLRRIPEFEFVFEGEDSVISAARIAKDETEIEAIKTVGRKAQEIYQVVVDFLASCKEKKGILYKGRKPVTIGDVKQLIKDESDIRNISASKEDVIFAQGRDAAVPHSRGEPEQVLKVGETLVFDFCPRDPKSGFFFDITRTFCVGFVPNEVQKVYERVLEVQTRILDTLELSKPARYYDELCSQMFEDWGYPTPRKNPGTTKGYVHGLGHGLGLEVHEPPRLSCLSQKNEPLKPGFVFTVEPGLYFPDEGYGVRLEDVVAIHTDGRIENLTPFSKEILIPLK